MKFTPILLGLVVFVAVLLIAASLADVHCIFIQTGDASGVLACRASRLEAHR